MVLARSRASCPYHEAVRLPRAQLILSMSNFSIRLDKLQISTLELSTLFLTAVQ